jgi:hypothetical protein
VGCPTAFELDLIDGGVRYVYGFSATQEKIIDEWLYQYPKGSPQNLIDRKSTNQWGTMSALKGKKKIWQESTLKSLIFDKSSPFFTKISFISSEIFASSAVSLDTTKSSIPIQTNGEQ